MSKLKTVYCSGGFSDVYVEGEIGARSGTTAASFREQLARVKGAKQLRVHFNSVGGIVTEGMAIYNALRAFGGNKVGVVDGLAASIASVILMACDEIKIAKGGFIMIHNPSGGVHGGADDLRKGAEQMEMMRSEILDIYETRTGIDRAKLEKLIDAETYFTAEEAVTLGVADSVETFEAKLTLEAVAKLDPNKVPAGLLASAKGKKTEMKSKKMEALEEEMKNLKARMAEEGGDDAPEDAEDDGAPEDSEDDDAPTDAEEEEEKKNILKTIQEFTGETSFVKAAAKLVVRLSKAHSQTVTSRADIVSALIKTGKLEPSMKAQAMRASEAGFRAILKGVGASKSITLGGKHKQPETPEEKPDSDEPTAAELKAGRAMGLSVEQIKAARKQPMIYGKAAE